MSKNIVRKSNVKTGKLFQAFDKRAETVGAVAAMGLHTILYVTERDTLKEIVQFSRDAYMRCWSTRVGNEAESKIYGPLPGVYTHISGIDSIQVSIIFFLILIVTVSLSKSLRELGPFHKLLLLFWRICQASTR